MSETLLERMQVLVLGPQAGKQARRRLGRLREEGHAVLPRGGAGWLQELGLWQ